MSSFSGPLGPKTSEPAKATQTAGESVPVYHEKQTRQLCALHALNNLFQDGAAFRKHDLDAIACTLAPNSIFNPHMSPFGLGNYDVNVIQIALQNKNYEAIWFNKSKDPNILNLANVYGFILNIVNVYDIWKSIATLFTTSKRHWIAVRSINSHYYNLDSKLNHPILIGNEEKLIQYLRKHLSESNTEIFIIVTQEMAQNKAYEK